MYDIETQVIAFFHITPASVNEMKARPEILLEAGAYYIFDQGYNYVEQFFRIDIIGASFGVRVYSNSDKKN